MTNADFEESISGLAEEDLSAVAELLARPFPEGDYQDASGCGGPGFHLVVLEASRDLWDAPDEGVVRAAEANLQARLDALAVKLVARWGEPTDIDLWPYLRAGLEGCAVPEPLNCLCQLAGSMRVWPRPDSGRWLALTIGQGDKELPFELIVAVGTTEALDPTNGEIEGPPAGSLSFTARPLPAAVEAFRQGDQVH